MVDTRILHHETFGWIKTDCQNLPSGAVVGGMDHKKPLYIARCEIENDVVVGKFQPEHGCAYFPHGGREHCKSEVDVLCCFTKHL